MTLPDSSVRETRYFGPLRADVNHSRRTIRFFLRRQKEPVGDLALRSLRAWADNALAPYAHYTVHDERLPECMQNGAADGSA